MVVGMKCLVVKLVLMKLLTLLVDMGLVKGGL